MGVELFGIPFLPLYDVGTVRGVVTLLIVMLVLGFMVHLAAKWLTKKDDIHMGIVAAVVGILLAHLAFNLTNREVPIVGVLVAVLAFIAAIAAVYRTKLPQSVAVGAVTWVMWIVANMALSYVQANWHG